MRDAGQPYRSTLYDFLRGHSDVVARLAIEMYARGLSTRDVEAAFTDERGTCLLSKSAVSELTDELWTEYEAFQQRSLGEVPILALYTSAAIRSISALPLNSRHAIHEPPDDHAG